MKYTMKLGAITLTAALMLGTASSAETTEYLREGSETIQVIKQNGKLYCRRVSDGYEMCNGMVEQADGTWQGRKMKHPDMPGFMKFRGTVTFKSTGLSIKGCAIGICDTENWTKK